MMICRSDYGAPVRVRLTDMWTEKTMLFPSQRAASRYLGREPKYVNHIIRAGELARSVDGMAYDVEVL